MASDEFEGPLFKRLPANDTGDAPGHVGGFLVPKQLAGMFPALPEATTEAPTPSAPIRAILVVGTESIGTVESNFRHETWGATRKPERRVTANLSPLRDQATEGDLLLIERNVEDELLYRFTLLKRETNLFVAADRLTGGRRWGLLEGGRKPVEEGEVQIAEHELEASQAEPFQPFEPGATTLTVRRIARGRAFRRLVVRSYNYCCAFCGGGLMKALGVSEVEAAHIIRRGNFGSDDVRNGLALCRAHHWAFDQGLIAIDENSKILVKEAVLEFASNGALKVLVGKPLQSPKPLDRSPHPDAMAWHKRHVFDGHPVEA